MTQKRFRRTYEPPRARDLSAMSVAGEGPEGACIWGPYPYYNCVAGPVYYDNCVTGPTVDVSDCSAGGMHTWPDRKSVV